MQPRDKSRLYHDLGQLIRSGMTLPRAVEKLAEHSRGSARGLLHGIGGALANGDTVAEAVARQPQINELDTALFAASERAGRLDRGFDLASEYYNALAEARSRILRKSAYPIFVLHFGVVALSLSRLFGAEGGFQRVGEGILTGFGILWGAMLVGWLIIVTIRQIATRNVGLDQSLGMIPVIGGMRRDLALSRFSAAYDMQLEAGVNVIGALEAAGRATASANYRAAVDKALPEVRTGGNISTALVGTRAFPDRLIRAFMVGEESGRLDQELRSVSEEYRVSGLRKLEMLSEWIPRMIFIAVAGWVVWVAVSSYVAYIRRIQEIIGQ